MESNLILVTGATGYIASQLIPRLLEAGYRVRALAREPRRLDGRAWARRVDVFSGDVTDAASLRSALEGVHTAYYLVHNMKSGRGYTEKEIEGARNFAQAAEAAGVRHIIYLGGLADPEQHIAPHMRSRIETGRVLRAGGVPVTEFRAGVIVGSGSISFEMIRFLTELFPLIPGPLWLKNKSQPIAVQNVMDYLLAALENRDGHGQVFEIGGPEVLPYGELMLRYARLRGLKRRILILPHLPLWFMAFGIDLVTPVPRPIAYALVGGLGADSVVLHPEALRVFPDVRLLDYETAVRQALTRLHPARIERVWEDGSPAPKSLKHEGFFIRQYRPSGRFPDGDVLNGWQVETREPNQYWLFRKPHPFGEEWQEWRTVRDGIPIGVGRDGIPIGAGRDGIPTRAGRTDSPTYVTCFFAPRGPLGFLYWYLLDPFRILKFNGLSKAATKKT